MNLREKITYKCVRRATLVKEIKQKARSLNELDAEIELLTKLKGGLGE